MAHSRFDFELLGTLTGEVGAGSTAVAVAAAQAAIATLPMQPGRRGSGALKAPYAAALGN